MCTYTYVFNIHMYTYFNSSHMYIHMHPLIIIGTGRFPKKIVYIYTCISNMYMYLYFTYSLLTYMYIYIHTFIVPGIGRILTLCRMVMLPFARYVCITLIHSLPPLFFLIDNTAKREPLRNVKIRFFLRRNTFFFGSRHCASVLETQVPKLCTDLDLSLHYILILGTYSKFARKNNFLALGVCFLQPCSSAGRRFAASRSRLQNYRRIVSFPQPKIR